MNPSTADSIVTQPYPGLRPFQERDSEFFFGRADQISRMLACLEEGHFLAVVGGSGSGKSSLVRAGLLPALKEGYLLGAGTNWKFVVMRPAGDPIGNLALEFQRAVRPGDGAPDPSDVAFTRATLKASPNGFLEAIEEARLEEGTPVLLLVDQFEEIFRFRQRRSSPGAAQDDDRESRTARNEAAAFVNLLLTTAETVQQTGKPVYVVITMRSDFIGNCDVFAGFPEAVSASQFLVPRMTRRQIQQAIEKPLLRFGCTADPGMVNQMLNDVGTEPDQLPLLQHALMRTWFAAEDRWKKTAAEKSLMPADYTAAGLFSHALSQHLTEAWDSLDSDRSRQIAQRLFICLSERSAEGALIRRMAKLGEVAAVAGATVDEVGKVVDVFRQERRNFIMASPPGALGAESVLDISHEALLRQWAPLASWLEEEAKAAETYVRLADHARRWKDGKAELLRGRELRELQDWKEERNPTAAWAERYRPGSFDIAMRFLAESRAESNNSLARAWLDRHWRPWGFLLTALAVGAFVWAFNQKDKTNHSRYFGEVQKTYLLVLNYLEPRATPTIAPQNLPPEYMEAKEKLGPLHVMIFDEVYRQLFQQGKEQDNAPKGVEKFREAVKKVLDKRLQ